MRLSILLSEARSILEAHEDNFWVVTSGLDAHQIATAMGTADPSQFHHVAKGKLADAFSRLTPEQRNAFRAKLGTFRKPGQS